MKLQLRAAPLELAIETVRHNLNQVSIERFALTQALAEEIIEDLLDGSLVAYWAEDETIVYRRVPKV